MSAELWFEKYATSIYKYILLILKDPQLAEDLTQETFVKAFIHEKQFKGDSEVKTWLYRIAYTTTMNHFRKKHPIPALFNLASPVKSVEVTLIEYEEVKEVYEAITKLKMTYQQVIILRKVQQFSIEETSAILGWTEGKVKMQLLRALKSLRKILSEKGVGHNGQITE